MEMTIRKAQPSDAPALHVLMCELIDHPEDAAHIEAILQKIAEDDHYYLLLLCEGEELCASAMGVYCYDILCGGFLVIENVIVSSAHRRKGLGKKLFDELERWGKARGCTYSMLVSGKQRKEAHRMYEALGYTLEAGFRKYFE